MLNTMGNSQPIERQFLNYWRATPVPQIRETLIVDLLASLGIKNISLLGSQNH